MPKSTLSRQVAELERAVGVRLLSRTTRKVALTEAGERYLERCERIVAEAQIAHEELQHLVSTPTGPLRVNMPADFGTDFLAAAFVEFSKRYPAVTFHLDLAAPEHAGQVFHTCDVSIEIGELPDSTQIARLLGAIPAMLYAAPQYIAVNGFPRHPDELAKHEFLEFRSSQANRATAWPLRSGKEQVMVQPKSRFSVNSIAMLRQLAVRGVGIAGLDEAGCEAEVRAGRLIRVLPDWHGGPFPVYAVTETRLLPAKTSIFVDFLAEWLTRHWSLGAGPALIGQRPKAALPRQPG